jgi:protein phosphatase
MIRVASLSLQGKRATNQDRVLIAPSGHLERKVVAAVADGLGGMQAGDKAAEIAVQTLSEAADELLEKISGDFEEAGESLINVYQRANDRIRTYAETYAKVGAVGTTLVTLTISGNRYLIANTGDSRCYAVNGAGVQQITQDHTVADSLLRHGVMNEKDYPSSPLRNQLTRSLGPKAECEPDIFPEVAFGVLDHDCTFLLCSDGFYVKLTNTDLGVLAKPASSLDAVLQELAAEALERQTSDNLSAVIVRFEK